MLSATALEGLPEVRPGDDVGALIANVLADGLQAADVLVVAHKVISKAEGRIRALADVRVTDRARRFAAELGKEPRQVQVVLDESAQILRAERGVLISVTRHGFVCANAGVDASNVAEGFLVLLPIDPDASAAALRRSLEDLTGTAPGIVITDSFGRGWRHGQTDVAIGCAGVSPLEDWRGRTDATGRELRATWIAVADELAAAADLARAKDAGQPVVLVRGAGRHVTVEHGPGAAAMIRPQENDLFR